MINPDGVVCGNSTMNMAGYDLAHSWANPNKLFTPESAMIKEYL